MKIGLFGDSYLDLVWYRYAYNNQPSDDKKIWAQLLLEDLGAPIICSGLGGTSQYYAIEQWQDWSEKMHFDVAIFTLTWSHRQYTSNRNEAVLRAYIEGRDLEQKDQEAREIESALEAYYQHLFVKRANDFMYELMIKWCMELPQQHPNTKFIFIPNTEQAQVLAKKHYTDGVLFDMAMETLSLAEGERVGVRPFIPDRIGHLSPGAHQQVKELVKKRVLDYVPGIVPVNVADFGLTNLYPGYYDKHQ